jgi:hypothetical protein
MHIAIKATCFCNFIIELLLLVGGSEQPGACQRAPLQAAKDPASVNGTG